MAKIAQTITVFCRYQNKIPCRNLHIYKKAGIANKIANTGLHFI